jgi:hypothetical protein
VLWMSTNTIRDIAAPRLLERSASDLLLQKQGHLSSKHLPCVSLIVGLINGPLRDNGSCNPIHALAIVEEVVKLLVPQSGQYKYLRSWHCGL